VFSTIEHLTVLSLIGRWFAPDHRVVARCPTMPTRAVADGSLAGWRLWLLRLFYRLADVVIAQTPEMEADIVRVFGVDPHRVRVITNPLDSAFIEACLENVSNPFEGRPGESIVAIGTLTRKKGFDTLLEAFCLLRRERPSARLYILGRDSDGTLADLTRQARELGVSDAVTFAGFVENPYPYLRYSDLFVLSSRTEGLPNVLIEARYLGCRVAATKCLPVVERIMGGRFLARVGDAQELSNAMGQALKSPPLAPLPGAGVEGFIRVFEELAVESP
jgi:glycosyltransferase involved in cell wall biosynthesis